VVAESCTFTDCAHCCWPSAARLFLAADEEARTTCYLPDNRLVLTRTHLPLWEPRRWPAIAVRLAAALGTGPGRRLHRLPTQRLALGDTTLPSAHDGARAPRFSLRDSLVFTHTHPPLSELRCWPLCVVCLAAALGVGAAPRLRRLAAPPLACAFATLPSAGDGARTPCSLPTDRLVLACTHLPL
jgi:hypothetical protein